MPTDDAPQDAAPPRDRSLASTRRGLMRAVGVAVVVLFALFAIANRQPVDFSWLIGETRVEPGAGGAQAGGVPLIVLLVASFVLGAVAGAALVLARGRRRGGRR